MSTETGWYRIELTAGARQYNYDDSLAAVIAAYEWLKSAVEPEIFAQWWREHI